MHQHAKSDDPKTTVYLDSLKYIEAPNPLLHAFFSKANLDYLQNQIIQQVYLKSGKKYKISRQSDNELLIIMRSIYLSTRKVHHGPQVKEEVAKLNQMVLQDVIPRIMCAVEGYLGYLNDRVNPRQFIENPKNTELTGLRLIGSPTMIE